jgi:hypothetical protein
MELNAFAPPIVEKNGVIVGRVYDEENYQIGFVDIADTPHPEIIYASKAIGREMYKLRAAHRVSQQH